MADQIAALIPFRVPVRLVLVISTDGEDVAHQLSVRLLGCGRPCPPAPRRHIFPESSLIALVWFARRRERSASRTMVLARLALGRSETTPRHRAGRVKGGRIRDPNAPP